MTKATAERERDKGKEIHLTIKLDYLPTWGLWEGVREMIQNAKDAEAQFKAAMSISHDAASGCLTITNDGATLSASSLLLGHTSKAGAAGVIGQFGEGLKLGLLALVRAGHAVTIRNGAEVWTPIVVRSEDFGEDVLAVRITPSKARANRVSVEIGGVDAATWAEYRERFLFITKPAKDDCVKTHAGDLLKGERFKGRVYVKGIYVQTLDDLNYGYSFNDARVDRDRRMVESWDRARKQAEIWKAAMEESSSLIGRFGDLLAESAKDVEGVNEHSADFFVTEEVASKLATAFRKAHGNKAIPVANMAESADIEHFGRRGVVVAKGLQAALAKVVGSMETVKKDLANEVVKTYGWSDLTAEQRVNLTRAMDLVKLAGEVVTLEQVSVVDFRSDTLEGMFNTGTGAIKLAAKVVANPRECLATLIHEVAHRHGSDGDKGHVAAIESIWALVVEALTNAAPAAPAESKEVKAPRHVPAAKAEWGRVGTAAEAYKRLIMTATDGETTAAQIFQAVLNELGPAKAGKPSYVGWYRNALLKDGHAVPVIK